MCSECYKRGIQHFLLFLQFTHFISIKLETVNAVTRKEIECGFLFPYMKTSTRPIHFYMLLLLSDYVLKTFLSAFEKSLVFKAQKLKGKSIFNDKIRPYQCLKLYFCNGMAIITQQYNDKLTASLMNGGAHSRWLLPPGRWPPEVPTFHLPVFPQSPKHPTPNKTTCEILQWLTFW